MREKKRALCLIGRYYRTLAPSPRCGLTDDEFRIRSNTRYAIREIENAIRAANAVSPLEVVEGYTRLMDHYACISKTEEAAELFSVCYEVGQNVADILLTPDEFYESKYEYDGALPW